MLNGQTRWGRLQSSRPNNEFFDINRGERLANSVFAVFYRDSCNGPRKSLIGLFRSKTTSSSREKLKSRKRAMISVKVQISRSPWIRFYKNFLRVSNRNLKAFRKHLQLTNLNQLRPFLKLRVVAYSRIVKSPTKIRFVFC